MYRKIFILTIVLFALSFGTSWAQQPIARVDDFLSTGVAVSGTTIMYGDTIGSFYAVDKDTRASKWSYRSSDSSATGTPALVDDKVIFAQVTGEITCLTVADGSLVWRYAPRPNDSMNEVLNDGVAVGGGKVYAAFSTGELRALDLNTGRVAWTYTAEQGLRTAPIYSNGLVLLGEYNGLFSMLDAKTGKRVNGGGAGGAINTPSVSNGNVYYSAWDGSIHAVQIKDVIPLWDAKVGEPITTSPMIRDGLLIVGTAGGKVFALNQTDGSIAWRYDSKGSQLKLAFGRGRVLVGTEDYRGLMLDPKNGRLINEFSAGYFQSSSDGSSLYFVKDNNMYEMN